MKIHQYIVYMLCFRQCLSQDIFFPFGTDEGDSSVPTGDDVNSRVDLSSPFPFFGNEHSFLYVCTNGFISFLIGLTDGNPDPIPLVDNDWQLIAPFWADANANLGGAVYYREVLRHNNEDLTERATVIVRDTFIDQDDFNATWLFIATWDGLSYYGSTNTDLTNTFQAVLLTDGCQSFTIFHYGDIVWTTGTTAGGSADTGLGGSRQAQVGANAGDGQNFYIVPESGTDAIVDIETTTNVGVIGRWVFRNTEGNNCQDEEGCDMECLNGGACITNDDSTSVCQCPYGFIGPTCKRVVAYCTCLLP